MLRTATGAVVRVDPPHGVKVHGEIDGSVRHDYTHRTQVLEVKHGDEVHVYGLLSGTHTQGANAYRVIATMPTLSATNSTSMVISREKPGVTARKRASVFRNLAIASLVWIVFATSIVCHSFTVLLMTGEPTMATIEAVGSWRKWIKPKRRPGYWDYHYEIRATANGRTVSDEVSYSLYDDARNGSIRTVPFLVSSVDPEYHQVGSRPHTNNTRLVLLKIAAVLWIILYPVIALSTRPWYSKKKLKRTDLGTIADGDARESTARK